MRKLSFEKQRNNKQAYIGTTVKSAAKKQKQKEFQVTTADTITEEE